MIGYSYARNGTEIGLFDLDAQGGLRYRDTYQLRSNDYYSARNYASRLIGDKLIFYTPLRINPWADESDAFLPALRHWHRDATPADFKRILPATRIYRTTAQPPGWHSAAHVYMRLAAKPMRESQPRPGPSGLVCECRRAVSSGGSVVERIGQPRRPVFRIPDGSEPRQGSQRQPDRQCRLSA